MHGESMLDNEAAFLGRSSLSFSHIQG